MVRTKIVILRYGVADSAGLHMFAASAGEVQCLLLFKHRQTAKEEQILIVNITDD